MRDIVDDPGNRKAIDEFHHDIRDEARRAYLQKGPYRPAGHKFPKTKVNGKGQPRGFVGSWFDQFDWLEYSVAKDAAYCFYCYLFKPQQTGFHSNDTFTRVGFRNWKNAKDSFKEHAQSIDGFHNNARKRALDFINQRQSVEHVWTVTSAAEEEAYKARLTIMLGIARFLLSGLITKMESFEFVFILHLMIRVLGLSQELSQCLQRKNQNIVRAIGLIGSVMRNMNAMRENGWDDLFEEVKSFCVQKKIDIPNMEDMIPVRGRSKFRGAKLVTHYHHFHHGIFIVVIDQILCELNNRFPERSTELLRCVACLDPNGSFANFEIEKLVELAKIYKDDFSDYDCEKLRGDLLVFIDEVRNDKDFGTCTDLGNLAEKMVQSDRHTHFPLVYRLIELALILPVATTTVERAFSAMNIIKTERRNKMNDDWMNNSMICYIERDVFASVEDEKFLKRFQGFKNCKINLPREGTRCVLF